MLILFIIHIQYMKGLYVYFLIAVLRMIVSYFSKIEVFIRCNEISFFIT